MATLYPIILEVLLVFQLIPYFWALGYFLSSDLISVISTCASVAVGEIPKSESAGLKG